MGARVRRDAMTSTAGVRSFQDTGGAHYAKPAGLDLTPPASGDPGF